MTLPQTSAGASFGAPLRRVLTLACAATLLAALAGCTASGPGSGGSVASAVDPAPSRLVPSVSPAPVRAAAAQLIAPLPPPGSVRLEDGPFTDRLAFTGLALQDGSRVVGTVANTVDVSEFILLQLDVDFYDGAGRLLGSGSASYADQEFADNGATALPHGTGQHDDGFEVTITGQPEVTRAVSAVLTVPQLVNE